MNREAPGIKSNFIFLLSLCLMMVSIGVDQIISHPHGFWGYLFLLAPILISLPKPKYISLMQKRERNPVMKQIEHFLGLERAEHEMPEFSTRAEYDCVAFQFFTPGPFDHILKEPLTRTRVNVDEDREAEYARKLERKRAEQAKREAQAEKTAEIKRPPREFKPHELLGVAKDADASEINRAYREKIKWLHPDALAGCSEEQLQYYQAASARLNSARSEMLKSAKRVA